MHSLVGQRSLLGTLTIRLIRSRFAKHGLEIVRSARAKPHVVHTSSEMARSKQAKHSKPARRGRHVDGLR